MERNDHNRTSEQTLPADVVPVAEDVSVQDEPSIAPTFVTPPDVNENSDRPVVNPVTGGAF